MKKSTLLVVMAIGLVGSASAGVIWEASTENTTLISNFDPLTTTLTTGEQGLELSVADGNKLAMNGFTSTESVNTLNGTALTLNDTVTFSGTITGITGTIRANGVEFGMNPDATTFRADDNLIYSLKAQSATSLIVGNAFQDTNTGTGLSYESHIKDGFDYTLVVNASGYTFTINDVRYSGDTSETTITQSGYFTGNEFLENFSDGHFYIAVQKFNASDATVMSISEASISVVPEPATMGLVAVFGGVLLFVRRRCMTC